MIAKRILIGLACSFCLYSVVQVAAQTVAETDDRITAIEAQQAKSKEECMETRRADPTREGARREMGRCLVAASAAASAALEALQTEQNEMIAQVRAETEELKAFLETLEELRVAADGNQAALAQITDLRGELETVAERVAAIRAETAAITASADAHAARAAAFKARSAIYEAQTECIWDAIARDTDADCADPAVYQRFLVD